VEGSSSKIQVALSTSAGTDQLHRYWFGSPDENGRNLATCVWRTQHDARVGSVGEAHRRAGAAARVLYTEWKIERLELLIKDNVDGWEIKPWAR
jgi:hypothetical protein